MTSAAPAAPAALRTIALGGNPNCGKTTLFNALTGLRQKVANYPGITVEKKTGRCTLPDGHVIDVLDLPGTYSLVPNSPDEQVAMEILRGLRPDTPPPDVIVAVVDASNLARNLYLVSQLIELRQPMVVALNMSDIASRRGQPVDAAALARELGVPVVPVIGHKRHGVEALKDALAQATVPPLPAWPLPEAFATAITTVGSALAALPTPERERFARRLLAQETAADLAAVRADPAVAQALAATNVDPAAVMQADIEARYRWIDTIVARVVQPGSFKPGTTMTDRVDAVLVHPVLGLGIFGLIMATLFVTLFLVADPLMGMCEAAVSWLGELVTGNMDGGTLKSLLADGVFAGVGGVVVFVPQIALLFLFLAILEDSGYLARAAFLMDKLLSKVGLHGRSFIPMLSSFACAIPGIMATRTIESRNERLATILVAPFMSCSARLPVYGLLIGAFFGSAMFAGTPYEPYIWLIQGGIMLACYVLGILAAVVTAYGCKLFLGKGAVTPFILELPTYKFPQLGEILRHMWTNTAKFLTKAGTIIFCLSILLWAMAYFPRLPNERIVEVTSRINATPVVIPTDATIEQEAEIRDARASEIDSAVAGAQLEYSISGRIGHVIEPVIAPLGYDWKIGVGLIAAFAAREVFVGHMGIVYSLGDPEDDADKVGKLEETIRADTYSDGRPVWTPMVAVSLLVWFVLAMQCISTTAVVRRETGGWKWPLFQMAYMNVVAYVAALVTYQVGSRLFGG
ncbi:MAG: ferrous iron transport protein B [Planctomycetes bacterium]|nr:ferrous iron transport protein B [Planctomycetota bacterium]